MNKILKYILKGKREKFSSPIIIGRLVILLIVLGVFSMVSYSIFLYLEGCREEKIVQFFKEKYPMGKKDSISFESRSILSRKLNRYLLTFLPYSVYEKTKTFHHRIIFINFEHPELEEEDFKKFSRFKHLIHLYMKDSNITDLTPLEGLPILNLALNSNANLKDLSPLKGSNIKMLDITYTSIEDLTPLEGMKVEQLFLDNTPVTDLSPIKRTSIKDLSLKDCKEINDLSPLEGLPLESLNLSNTKITDISPLNDMPLLKLDLSGCSQVKNLKTIMSCKDLVELILPDEAEDIEFLKEHPRIQKIQRTSALREFTFTEDFWLEEAIRKNE